MARIWGAGPGGGGGWRATGGAGLTSVASRYPAVTAADDEDLALNAREGVFERDHPSIVSLVTKNHYRRPFPFLRSAEGLLADPGSTIWPIRVSLHIEALVCSAPS